MMNITLMNPRSHLRSFALVLAVSLVATGARAQSPEPSPVEQLPHPCEAPDPCGKPPQRDKVTAAPATPVEYNPNDGKLMHGFRIGYSATLNYDKPIAAFDGQSLQQKVGMRSPHHMLVGYEAFYRVVGHSWLNVIMVANANVAGLEESHFFPSGNFLLGGELNNSFQLGLGVHLEPLKGSEAHTILAAGWTPRVGTFYVPVHAFFIPDVDGVHRFGVTTGVTW